MLRVLSMLRHSTWRAYFNNRQACPSTGTSHNFDCERRSNGSQRVRTTSPRSRSNLASQVIVTLPTLFAASLAIRHQKSATDLHGLPRIQSEQDSGSRDCPIIVNLTPLVNSLQRETR